MTTVFFICLNQLQIMTDQGIAVPAEHIPLRGEKVAVGKIVMDKPYPRIKQHIERDADHQTGLYLTLRDLAKMEGNC